MSEPKLWYQCYVKIQTDKGDEYVPGWVCAEFPGIVITLDGSNWTVTHLPSGMNMCGLAIFERWAAAAESVHSKCTGMDFTQSIEDINASTAHRTAASGIMDDAYDEEIAFYGIESRLARKSLNCTLLDGSEHNEIPR